MIAVSTTTFSDSWVLQHDAGTISFATKRPASFCGLPSALPRVLSWMSKQSGHEADH